MMPKYKVIEQTLLEEIRTHKFMPGDKFYSEAEIKERFNVSSITAVKVLNQLTAINAVYRIQGKGTFVAKTRISESVRFSDIENQSPATEREVVVSVAIDNDPAIKAILNLTETGLYYHIHRIRYTGDVPILVHDSYIPSHLIHTDPTDLDAFSSIYTRIREDSGVNLYNVSSVETNEIVFPDKPEILNELQLSFREPAVKQIKTSFLADDSIAEYVVSYKHWRFFKTKIEINRS